MKILIIAPENEQLRPISNSIFDEIKNHGGCQIEMVELNIFYLKCTYFQKRLYKLGYRASEKIYDKNLVASLDLKYLAAKNKFVRYLPLGVNINTTIHHSLSPRTFEICATKSFQLMNGGQNSHGLMNLETDLATFSGVEDLLKKIEFYLANENLREEIAQ